MRDSDVARVASKSPRLENGRLTYDQLIERAEGFRQFYQSHLESSLYSLALKTTPVIAWRLASHSPAGALRSNVQEFLTEF